MEDLTENVSCVKESLFLYRNKNPFQETIAVLVGETGIKLPRVLPGESATTETKAQLYVQSFCCYQRGK